MKKLLTLLLALVLCLGMLAACTEEDTTAQGDLNAAGEYLFSLYKDDPTLTPSDFDVAGLVKIGGITYTVEWSVDVTEGVTIKASEMSGFFTVDVDEKTPNEITYTLTATIKNEAGESIQKTFTRTVPAYKMFTYAEYAAAADDETVVVQGIVTGIFSKSNGSSANGLYIQDLKGEGGYYVYGIKDGKDPSADLGVKVGMTVEVTGIKDTYSGLYEVIDGAVEITDSTVKTVEPVDYTKAFTDAAKLTDEALVSRQSMLVTIKGVEITGQDTKNGYYKFKIGENESYVRLSSSNNCITLAEKDTFAKTHTDNFGKSATVTGIVQLYNGSFYLIPASVDAFSDFKAIERSDAEKIQVELDNVKVSDRITENTVIELPLAGSAYTDVKFAWTSDNACAVIDATTGKLTITLPEDADAKVTLTLTITCGSATETKTFTMTVNSASNDLYLPEFVEDAPVADTTYKFVLYQANLKQNLYFAGYMSGNYLATTDKGDKAVDVKLEAVEGGFKIYFMDGETKKYIDIYEYTAGKAGVRITETPTAVYTYDATLKVMTAAVAGDTYYLGTYNNFNTISASKTSYISGDNASKVGVSQFVAKFATLVPATYVPEKVETPAADTAYKFTLYQTNLKQQLYFAGYMSGNYFATTDKADKAVDVKLEAVEGGFKIYFMDGETKKYIDIYEYTAGKAGVRITETPTAVFTYDATLKVFTAAVAGDTYYLGTYNNFNTISASKTSYISGDNASKVGVSQFVCEMVTLKLAEIAPVAAETPAADTAYKFTLYQTNLKQQLYFAGYMSGNYLATTDKISKATEVKLEAVEGGFKIYFMDGETKKYIDIYEYTAGKAGVRITDAPTAVFTYDATLKVLTAAVAGDTYYLGTYNNFNTISASKTSYISGDNASKVGVSQFVAQVATIEIVTPAA